MGSTGYEGETEHQGGYLGLLGLAVGLAGGGAALYTLAGPPHLPAALPSLDTITFTLRGSYLPSEALGDALTSAAWALWVWTVCTVLLRVLVFGLEVLTQGAAWVRSLGMVSDLVTLPVVRRLVDGALVALIVVNVVSQPATSAAADNTQPRAIVFAASFGDAAPGSQAWESKREERALPATQYAVRPGDTLWSIAERFYGTGHEYPRLVAANAGRLMPDGRRFTQAAVIHPDWVLAVPPAGRAADEVDGKVSYVVEQGDTLRGVAARFLGDEARWPEIFEINRDSARLPDGRILKDPGLIWPGLRLELPTASGEPGEKRLAPQPNPVAVEDAPSAVPPGHRGEQPTPVPTVPREKTDPRTTEPLAREPVPGMDQAPGPTGNPASPLAYGAAGLAGVAIAGGVALLARRRVRRSLDELPVRTTAEEPLAPGPFAEVEPARMLAHRMHGDEVEPAVLVANRLLGFLTAQGLTDISFVTACQGRNTVELTLSAPLLTQARLLDAIGEFPRRLGSTGQATLSSDGDIALRIPGLKQAGIMAQLFSRADDTLRLLPVGALPDRQTLFANWDELGHILIAGVPGAGTDVVLTSLICALAARCRPDELRLRAIASRRTLPDQLGRLPHLASAIVDPADGAGVSGALGQVRTELLARMRRAESDDAPKNGSGRDDSEIVLVIGELAEIDDEDGSLDVIALHGEEYRIRLLAATADPACLEDAALARFRTRLVLQTVEEDESIRLLGRPDAADLGDGAVLVRIDGRTPVRLRGLRVSDESLEQLLRVMSEAYPLYSQGAGRTEMEPAVLDPHPRGRTGTVEEEGRETSEHSASAGDPAEGVNRPGERGDDLAPGNSDTEGAGPPPRVGGEGRQTQPSSHEDEGTQAGEAIAVLASPDVALQTATPPIPIQIRCFGGFVVTSGDREISASSDEGTSFKAWEILAFLAAQPEGAASKEKLLEAIWPETDPERAANRMRVAMVRLRALLSTQVPDFPSEAVRCERDGTCRLDARVILSDVHQFVSLCRSAPKLPAEEAKAALARARAMYDGDLLTGAVACHAWVDERAESGLSLRESYREEYYRATQRLAELHIREGEPQIAIPLYRAILKTEPTLEDVVRALYRCYKQLGDLSSLIRDDRRLRQTLREAYRDPDDPEDDPSDYQPEPETVELFNTIREELTGKAARRGGQQIKTGGSSGMAPSSIYPR